MTAVEKMRLVIDGDSSGAKRALQSLGGDVRGLDRTTTGANSSMRGGFAKLSAAVKGSAAGFKSILKGDVKGGMTTLSSAVGGLGGAGLVAAGGIAAATGAVVTLAAAAKKSVDAIKTIGGGLSTLKRITGLSDEALTGLYGQLRMTDTETKAAAAGIAKFGRALDDARGGGSSLAIFQRLGVDVRDANGKLRDGNDVLGDTRRRLSEMKDAYERNAVAQSIFGRGFQSMGKWLTASQKDISRYDKIVAESGLSWGKKQQKTYAQFLVQQREMQFRWQLMWAVIGQKLLPLLERLYRQVLLPMTKRIGTIAGILDMIPGKANAIKAAFTSMLGPLYPALDALGRMLDIIERIKGGGMTNGDVRSTAAGIIGASPFGDLIKAVIPGFAAGGTVTRPTLAMIGEGGESEDIVPASKRVAYARGILGGGRMVKAEFNNCTFSATSPRELADMLGREATLALGGLA